MEQSSNHVDVDTPMTSTNQNQTQTHTTEDTPVSKKAKVSSKKSSKLTSDVWDHFTVDKSDKNNVRAICNYCDKDYAGGTRSHGTSTLRYHLINQCPKYPYRVEDKKQKILLFQKTSKFGSENVGGSNLLAVGFSQSDCRVACAKMIVIDELSFRFVEQEGFKLFCSVACPRFIIPSRHTIARDIMKLYNSEKVKLRDYFVTNSQRVSLTNDTWTSIQNVCYMLLTSHFIDNEWKMQKRILNFCEATLKFSASLFVTSNSYFHEVCAVRGKLLKWCSSDKLILKDMAGKMKLKFDKYWGNIEKQNMLLYVAVVLDPRYKLKFVTCCLRKLYGEDDVNAIISSLKSCLSKLMSHYSSELQLKNPEDVTQSGTINQDKSTLIDSDDDSFNFFESEFDKECDENDALDTKNELDRYLMERNEDRKRKDFDILVWWKMSSSKYPVLTEMARDVLAIQVSTVASESAFSTGGRVLDSFRSSLSPVMVQALICCQNWIRTSSLPLDMGSVLEDIDICESLAPDSSGASKVVDLD